MAAYTGQAEYNGSLEYTAENISAENISTDNISTDSIDLKELIDRERLLHTFCTLAQIDSESFHERQMADVLRERIEALGGQEIAEDDAGEKLSGDAGNLYAYFPGTLPGEPLLFSGHMDTVAPGNGKKILMQEDGRITSGGDTVLGADDLAGVASILEALQALDEQRIPRRSVEVLLPVAEEAYTQGSRLFDYTKIRAKEAYVLDISGPTGKASLREPTLLSFKLTFQGKAAHAGFAPEEGINAGQMAGRFLCSCRQGHIDQETTLNVGLFRGGTGTNVVPAQIILEGEIRSFVHEKALALLESVEEQAREAAEALGGTCLTESKEHLHAYQVQKEEPVVERFRQVCGKLGLPGTLTETFGGSDNNSFLRHGLRGIVLSCGMQQVHTTGEYIRITDLVNAARLTAGLMISH